MSTVIISSLRFTDFCKLCGVSTPLTVLVERVLCTQAQQESRVEFLNQYFLSLKSEHLNILFDHVVWQAK